jgi:hypothetical protein
MKVRVIAGGGYQGTTLVGMDAVPRVGDTINFGDYEGEVIKVIHVPVGTEHGKIQYRDEDEPGTQVVLAGSHLVRNG